MRHFLAVYKFYTDLSSQDLYKCLSILEKQPFKEKKEQKFVKTQYLNTDNVSVYGYIEYGVSGYKMQVYKYDTGEKTKEIEDDECPANTYFFRFMYIDKDKDKDKGILITERIGNVGIGKALLGAINNICGTSSIRAYPIIFGASELLNNGELKKIILRVKLFPKEIEEKLKRDKIKNPNDELEREIVLSTKRNKSIRGFLNWFRRQITNTKPSELGELIEQQFGEDVEQVKLVLNVNNSQRTLVFKNGLKFRSWLEIKRGSMDLEIRLKERLIKSEEIIEIVKNESNIEIKEEE